MSLGLPVLSPLRGFTYELVKKHEIGWNYTPKDSLTLAQNIMDIIESPQELKKRSANAKRLYETKFSYERVYDQLVYNLEKIINHQ